jgi:hypothetical protein
MDTITLTGGCLGAERMAVRCDLRLASSPVEVDYCEGSGWVPTQYQCADARHTIAGLAEIARSLAAKATASDVEDAATCKVAVMTKYYAVCDANGPISHSIEAESVSAAIAIAEAADMREWIDGADTDAENDLDIDGSSMSEDDFAAALEAAGYAIVCDMEEVHSHPSSPVLGSYHVAGGWRLWGPA